MIQARYIKKGGTHRKVPTFWMHLRHIFGGCWPMPRPVFASTNWGARHCPVCGRYPCGPWREGKPIDIDYEAKQDGPYLIYRKVSQP